MRVNRRHVLLLLLSSVAGLGVLLSFALVHDPWAETLAEGGEAAQRGVASLGHTTIEILLWIGAAIAAGLLVLAFTLFRREVRREKRRMRAQRLRQNVLREALAYERDQLDARRPNN